MKKLPKIKTLENKLWKLCREIIRLKYFNTCFTCGKENITGKDNHTGHFLKKRLLPFYMKYDLRLLRPQCARCNLKGNGCEGLYAINLVKVEGVEYLLEIDKDFIYYKSIEEPSIPDKREFLLRQIEIYKTIKQKLYEPE